MHLKSRGRFPTARRRLSFPSYVRACIVGKKITASSRRGGAEVRTMVLLGILAVLCLAFGYDYFYAKPLAQKVHDEIFNFCDDSITKPTGAANNKPKLFEPADIHKMLGEKFNGGKDYLPSKVTAEPPGHIVETYSIMAGAVIKTYDVHVIYTASDPASAKEGRSEAKFSTVVLGEYPKADLLPQGKEGEKNTPLPPDPVAASSGGGRPARGGQRPGGESATSGEKKEGENKEEEKKEEAPPAETKPETKPEDKPEGEKKEEAKPDESKPTEEKKEEPKPTEEKPAETPAKPEGEPKSEDKPTEKPAEPKL